MSVKYIDTHTHLNLSAFAEDALAVAQKCTEEGVALINVGTNLKSSRRAVELAKEADNSVAIVGLHPVNTVSGYRDKSESDKKEETVGQGEGFVAKEFDRLAESKKVVGVGECGFDYFHTAKDSYGAQEEAFIAQIEFANRHNLPLMIHTRNPKPGNESPTGRSVYEDVYEILKRYAKVPFNIHFYAGTYKEAKKFFDLGGTISFTGVITFTKDYDEVVKAAPLDLIHAETDAPYVAPVPYRGRRCEPWMVIEVYKKIAAIKSKPAEEVREVLLENAVRHYRLDLV